MEFPAATSYADTSFGQTIQASGTGSRIDLGHLATFDGGDSSASPTTIHAASGGTVVLAGAFSQWTSWTLSGVGSSFSVSGVTSLAGAALTAADGAVWVLPAGWQPTWGSGCSLTTTGAGSGFTSRAVLSPSVSVAINTSAFTNQGVLAPRSGGVLDFNGSLDVDGSGVLIGQVGGQITISGDLLGNTTNADLYAPTCEVRFDGSGTPAGPQQLETMSRDLDVAAAGFTKNFVYGTLSLSNNTYVKLVDLSDNSVGTEPEALYVNSLTVPAGTTLDLNGLHLCTRTTQIAGTVAGGTITQVPDKRAHRDGHADAGLHWCGR